MAQSVTRRIERNLTASVAFEPGQLIRPRSAESIKASGYVRPRRKAGHMTASDHCSSRKKFLQAGGHPHMRRPYSVSSFGNGSCVFRPKNVSGMGNLSASIDLATSSRMRAFWSLILVAESWAREVGRSVMRCAPLVMQAGALYRVSQPPTPTGRASAGDVTMMRLSPPGSESKLNV